MALSQRLMKPRTGERIEVYKNGELLIRGLVTMADDKLVSISGKEMQIVNFRPDELEEAIAKREISIKKL